MIFNKKKVDSTGTEGPKVTAGKLRLQNDIAEYNADGMKSVTIKFADEKNIMEMIVTVTPTNETFYHGANYHFQLEFPADYPMRPPKVELKHKIFHPNFDVEGHVCLPLVRGDWKPIYTLNLIVNGLMFLFVSPEPKDPLNTVAGALINDNIEEFKKVVNDTLRGGSYKGEKFDKMIK